MTTTTTVAAAVNMQGALSDDGLWVWSGTEWLLLSETSWWRRRSLAAKAKDRARREAADAWRAAQVAAIEDERAKWGPGQVWTGREYIDPHGPLTKRQRRILANIEREKQDPRYCSRGNSKEDVRYEFNRMRNQVVGILWKAQAQRTCPVCRVELHPGNCTVDHIIPIARGGSNHMRNFQLMCRRCNSSKGAR